jgi:hypothetical protein
MMKSFAQLIAAIIAAPMPQDPTSMLSKMRATLDTLTVLPEQRGSLDAYARILTITFLISRAWGMPANQEKGTKAALRELDAAERTATALAAKIRKLPSEARAALTAHVGSADYLQAVQVDISKFSDLARRARKHLAAVPPTAGPKGPPRKRGAAEMTKAARQIYEKATGKRAARGVDPVSGKPNSGFHKFLTGVFEAAWIEANADEQIRNLMGTSRAKNRLIPI